MKFEIDMDDDFMRTFSNAGATEAYCSCGRTHYAMLSYDDWNDSYFSDEMSSSNIIANLEAEAEKNDLMVLDYESDAVDLMTVGNKIFVAGCECEGWKPYMNFIVEQRKEIAKFLIETSKEIKRIQSYEEVMDILEKEYE